MRAHEDDRDQATGNPSSSEAGPDQAAAPGTGWVAPTAFNYEAVGQGGGDASTWAAAAGQYAWSGDYGEVGPEDPELEKQLFGDEHRMREGEHRSALDLEVHVEGPSKVDPVNKVPPFSSLPCYVCTNMLPVRGCWSPPSSA